MLPSSNVAARQRSYAVLAQHQRASRAVQQWFDTQDLAKAGRSSEAADRIDWARAVPFSFLHLACLAVAWVAHKGRY